MNNEPPGDEWNRKRRQMKVHGVVPQTACTDGGILLGPVNSKPELQHNSVQLCSAIRGRTSLL